MASLSFQDSPLFFELYFFTVRCNINASKLNTFAPSYAPMVTSKLLLSFFTQSSPSLCKTYFREWNITTSSLVIGTCSAGNCIASHNSVSLVDRLKSFIDVFEPLDYAYHVFPFIYTYLTNSMFDWFKICWLILLISYLDEFMSLVVGWFINFFLWSFKSNKWIVPFIQV